MACNGCPFFANLDNPEASGLAFGEMRPDLTVQMQGIMALIMEAKAVGSPQKTDRSVTTTVTHGV